MEHSVPRFTLFTGVFLLFVVLISLVITALMVWAYCRIFHKAGYHWALGLLMLLPIANIVVPFVLAFSDWPIEKQLLQVHQQQNKSGQRQTSTG